MKFHELSDIFPMMSVQEFTALKADIAANGLREPITTCEDKIVDGRNRYNACMELSIEPSYEEWDGVGNLVTFIVSMNLHRRHLNESQRAMVGKKLIPLFESEAKQRQATSTGGARPQLFANLQKAEPVHSHVEAAKLVNVSPRLINYARKLDEGTPELAQAVEQGDIAVSLASKVVCWGEGDQVELVKRVKAGEIPATAVKNIKKQKAQILRDTIAASGALLPNGTQWHVNVGDIKTYQLDGQFDFIITDPPYSREYLPLYGILAKRALEWLTPEGLLVVMCGQSYLDQIYSILSEYMTYYWTACYLTPGQPTPLIQRQVNTTWKPILIYSPAGQYSGKTFGDVYTSPNPEKGCHDWEQSVEGMYSLIKQICLPGQTIFDPFLGSGSTGVAALRHGCLFYGIDTDKQAVNISKARLANDKTEV